MSKYLTEEEVAEFNAKKDEKGRVWNGERGYSVLNKEKVRNEIKYTLTTFEENATKDAIYLTEKLDRQYAEDYFKSDNHRKGSSWKDFINGKEDGKTVYYEQLNGNRIQVLRRKEIYHAGVFIVEYTQMNNEVIRCEYRE